MLLYTNGCSFTYGDDLKNPIRDSWPTLLSKKYNMSLKNDATSGCDNLFIYLTTLDFVLSNTQIHDKLFIIIGWTSFKRIQYYENKKINFFVCYQNYHNILKPYLENIFLYNEQLYYILLSQILESFKIKYLFFNSLVSSFSKKYKYISSDYNLFFKKNNFLKNINFFRFVEQNNLPFSKTYHPLEKAHYEWAEYLYDYIRKKQLL